jgi:hypothetical protein
MDPSQDLIRRQALAAAASVVLAFGLSGCGGDAKSGSVDSAGGDSDADTDTDTDTDAAPDCTLDDIDRDLCCAELAAWCETTYGPDDFEAVSVCTFGPDYDGSTGCIPWGPPVPPSAAI